MSYIPKDFENFVSQFMDNWQTIDIRVIAWKIEIGWLFHHIARMNEPNDEYGLAFLYSDFYINIIFRRIPNRIRKILKLDIFFVDESTSIYKLSYNSNEIILNHP